MTEETADKRKLPLETAAKLQELLKPFGYEIHKFHLKGHGNKMVIHLDYHPNYVDLPDR